MSNDEFTVGDLRRHLAGYDDDTKLSFGGGLLTFYRLKPHDDDLVNIEFGEAQAYLDPQFKKRNPHIKVAYINADTANWDENGLLGRVNVSIR